jgi:hypothetical protein
LALLSQARSKKNVVVLLCADIINLMTLEAALANESTPKPKAQQQPPSLNSSLAGVPLRSQQLHQLFAGLLLPASGGRNLFAFFC